MSVMVLNDRVYDRVYKAFVMRGLGMTKDQAGVMVKAMNTLNQVAYNIRYKETGDVLNWEIPDDRKLNDIPPVVVHQLVRDLEAIHYNIQDGEVSDWLDNTIFELKESAEYKNNPSFEKYAIY